MSKFGPWRQTIYIIIHIPTVPHMAEPNFAKPCAFWTLKSYHPTNLATTLPQQGSITAVAIDDQSTQAFAKGFAGQQLTKKATRTGPRSITLSFPGGKNGRKSWMEEKELAFLWGGVAERYSYTLSWEHDRFCKKGCTWTNTSRIKHVIQKGFFWIANYNLPWERCCSAV